MKIYLPGTPTKKRSSKIQNGPVQHLRQWIPGSKSKDRLQRQICRRPAREVRKDWLIRSIDDSDGRKTLLCIDATHTEKQKKYLPQKVFETQKPVADFADKPLHDCRENTIEKSHCEKWTFLKIGTRLAYMKWMDSEMKPWEGIFSCLRALRE